MPELYVVFTLNIRKATDRKNKAVNAIPLYLLSVPHFYGYIRGAGWGRRGGGRLQHYADQWLHVIMDRWVVSTVSQGYRIEFTDHPPLVTHVRSTPLPQDSLLIGDWPVDIEGRTPAMLFTARASEQRRGCVVTTRPEPSPVDSLVGSHVVLPPLPLANQFERKEVGGPLL